MILIRIAKFAFYRIKIMGGSYQNLLALFVLPPLLILLTGQVMHEVMDPTDVPVTVVDLDKSEYSLTVLTRLSQHPMLSVAEADEDTARRQVVAGKKEVAFIIEQGFMNNIQDDRLDGIITVVRSPSSLLTEMLSEIIAGEVIRLTSNVAAADMVLESYRYFNIPLEEDGEKIWQQVWDHADSQWEPTPLVQLESYYLGMEDERETGGTVNRSDANNLIFMLGMLTVLIMFLTIFLNGWLVQDKSGGIWSRLQSSAVSINLYAVGSSLAVLVAVLISSIITLWLGSVFLPVAVGALFSPQLIVLLFFYLLSCLGLALFLAALARTTGQLQVMGIMVVVLTGVFGGIFFHLGDLSGHLDWLVNLMPQSWVLSGTREFLFYRQDWGAVSQPIAALSVFFIIFLGLSKKVGSRDD